MRRITTFRSTTDRINDVGTMRILYYNIIIIIIQYSKLIMEWVPLERTKKKTSKKNVDGRSTSSHDNKKFRNKSMKKQRGLAFGFRKAATVVIKLDG